VPSYVLLLLLPPLLQSRLFHRRSPSKTAAGPSRAEGAVPQLRNRTVAENVSTTFFPLPCTTKQSNHTDEHKQSKRSNKQKTASPAAYVSRLATAVGHGASTASFAAPSSRTVRETARGRRRARRRAAGCWALAVRGRNWERGWRRRAAGGWRLAAVGIGQSGAVATGGACALRARRGD
jgi:hypothetical protein